MRPPGLVALARDATYVFIVPDREAPISIAAVDVDALAAVLARCATPASETSLLEHCDATTLTTLVELGVLRELDDAPAPPVVDRVAKRCRTIVVGISATVGSIRSVDYLTALADGFADHVEVVVSDHAHHFVPPTLFEYFGLRTWTDAFTPAHDVAVPHIHLATTADVVLIAPASAATIHRLATGACADLISLIVAASTAPVIVAPAMNPAMWRHAAIQRNVAQLRRDQIWVIDPGLGVEISARDQPAVGGQGFDTIGLFRALDCVLTQAEAANLGR